MRESFFKGGPEPPFLYYYPVYFLARADCRVNIYTTSDFVKSSINFKIVFLASTYLYFSSL